MVVAAWLVDAMFNYMGGGLLPANPALGDLTSNGRGPFEMVDGNQVYGSDLVDLLDGMKCRGKVPQADMEELIQDAMDFGYAFDGPISCP